MKKNHNPLYGKSGYRGRFLFLVLAVVLFAAESPAQVPGYGYHKRLDIDNSQVSGSADFTNFTILVDFTDSALRTTANGGNVENANGWDIVFTAADGSTLLNHQLVSYDGSTGHLVAWVQIPTLQATTDTPFYIFYGNASVSADPSTDSTWDTNWKGVWHLEESGNGTAGEYKDATAYGNDGQGGAGNTSAVPSRVAGKIGYAQQFDGNDDYISVGSDASLNIRNQITVDVWAKMDQRPAGGSWLDLAGSTTYYPYIYGQGAADARLHAWIVIDGTTYDITGRTNLAPGSWYHLVMTYDGYTIKCYVNGQEDLSESQTGTIDDSASDDFLMAIFPSETQYFDGPMDEIRVAGVARSSDWIATEFNNQDAPGSFLSEVSAPFLDSLENTALAYTAGDSPTAITDSVTTSDPLLTNLQGATVQITGNYVSSEDVLNFTDTATITGSWDSSTGKLTLSGNATLAEYQAALRSVTYENTEATIPNINTRTVSFMVDNGTYLSNTVTRDITVAGIYDAVWEGSGGSRSTEWAHSNNWNSNSVPGTGESAYIPVVPANGVDFPIVDVNNQTVGSVVVQTGADVTVSGGITFVVEGALQGGGEVNGSGSDTLVVGGDLNITSLSIGEVVLNGSAKQTIISPLSISGLTTDNSGTGVDASDNLSISGMLSLASGTLTIPSGKSLIANTKSITSGSLRFRRSIPDSGWYMLSSPVNATYQDLLDSLVTQGFPNTDYPDTNTYQPNVLWYDETFEGTHYQRWRRPGDAVDTVAAGKGYMVYAFGDVPGDADYTNTLPTTLTANGQEFEGALGSFDFGVTYSAGVDSGWNLIGNPFGATVDWDATGKWTKTNIDATIYVWDHTASGGNGDYLVWNGTAGSLGNGLIPPFQGFWVKANAASPSLVLDNTVKTTGGVFHKPTSPPPVVALRARTGELEGRCYLTLSPDGKPGKDRYDAYRLVPFSNTFLELSYLLDNGRRLTINNMPADEPVMTLPLVLDGYRAGQSLGGEVAIGLDTLKNVPDFWALYLRDTQTGQSYDLRQTNEVLFDLSDILQKKGKSSTARQALQKIVQTTTKPDVRFRLVIDTRQGTPGIPSEYRLHQNFPNPVRDRTVFGFELPEQTRVMLTLYDLRGNRCLTLADRVYPAGVNQVPQDLSGLASGIYLYQMKAGSQVFGRKLLLVK